MFGFGKKKGPDSTDTQKSVTTKNARVPTAPAREELSDDDFVLPEGVCGTVAQPPQQQNNRLTGEVFGAKPVVTVQVMPLGGAPLPHTPRAPNNQTGKAPAYTPPTNGIAMPAASKAEPQLLPPYLPPSEETSGAPNARFQLPAYTLPQEETGSVAELRAQLAALQTQLDESRAYSATIEANRDDLAKALVAWQEFANTGDERSRNYATEMNDRLTAAFAENQRLHEESARRAAVMKGELDKTQEQLATLRKLTYSHGLEAEEADKKAKAAEERAKAAERDATDKIAAEKVRIESEMATIRTSMAEMQRKLAQSTQRQEEVERKAQRAIVDAEAKKAAADMQLREIVANKARMEGEINVLGTALTNLAKDKDQATREAKQAREEVAAANKEKADLAVHNQRLIKERDNTKAEYLGLQSQRQDAEEAAKRANREVESAKKQTQDLAQLLSQMAEKQAIADRGLAEAQRMKGEAENAARAAQEQLEMNEDFLRFIISKLKEGFQLGSRRYDNGSEQTINRLQRGVTKSLAEKILAVIICSRQTGMKPTDIDAMITKDRVEIFEGINRSIPSRPLAATEREQADRDAQDAIHRETLFLEHVQALFKDVEEKFNSVKDACIPAPVLGVSLRAGAGTIHQGASAARASSATDDWFTGRRAEDLVFQPRR